MSVVDKVIAAVTPPESEKARAKARQEARAAAGQDDWLSLALDHHLLLEDAFAAVKSAGDRDARLAARERLGVVLTGHAIAEEAVLYPALAQVGEKAHAGLGYTEQVAVKMQMAELENIDPMTKDYLDQLEHIRGAVAHHMFEEEGTWFLELKDKASPAVQAKITEKYQEAFDRYVGADA